LRGRRIPCRIIEKDASRVAKDAADYTLIGDATDPELLQQAGLGETSTVLITTRDDDANIFLTICCRRLRPDIEIVGRATHTRNVGTMHRAGADLVLSYASMGANLVFNRLRRQSVMHVAEGLDVVAVPIGRSLAGKTLVQLDLPTNTGCLALAIRSGGQTRAITDPTIPLPDNGDLIVVGDQDAEDKLMSMAQS
jgi:Trk K+ transport system NAD-binding subunit